MVVDGVRRSPRATVAYVTSRSVASIRTVLTRPEAPAANRPRARLGRVTRCGLPAPTVVVGGPAKPQNVFGGTPSHLFELQAKPASRRSRSRLFPLLMRFATDAPVRRRMFPAGRAMPRRPGSDSNDWSVALISQHRSSKDPSRVVRQLEQWSPRRGDVRSQQRRRGMPQVERSLPAVAS